MSNFIDMLQSSEEDPMLMKGGTHPLQSASAEKKKPDLTVAIVSSLKAMNKFRYFFIIGIVILIVGCLLFLHTKNQEAIENAMSQQLSDFKQIQRFSQQKYLREILNLRKSQNTQQVFPRVIWLYTEFKFESEKMLEQMLGNYLRRAAEDSGFEVRFVNSWSAYEWLSPETESKITKTKHRSVLEHKVDDLLRWGLLMEHGGVMIKLSENFFIQKNLDWLNKYMQVGDDPKDLSPIKVLLFSEQQGLSPPQFQDHFIAAAKNASLIRDVFASICDTLISGTSEHKRVKQATYNNKEVNSIQIRNMTRNIIQTLIEQMTTEYYEVATVKVDISKFTSPSCRDHLSQLLQQPDWKYKEECGIPSHIIHISDQIDRPRIEEELEQQLVEENLKANSSSYWNQWMTIPPNKKLVDPLPPRQISFCLLDAHPTSDPSSIEDSLSQLKEQTFKNWTAVYFVNKVTEDLKSLASKGNLKVVLAEDTGSVGRNYELGIIRHCPSKSFVVVLRNYQRFKEKKALEKLSAKVVPRGVLGVFAGLEVKGQILRAESNYENYSKLDYNGKQIRYVLLNNILNHLRVFHSDCYKIIPQFQLRTHDGTYYNDRFIFLEQFLIMVRNITAKHDDTEIPHQQRVKWYIKSNANLYDVPNTILVDHDLIIVTDKWEQVDKQQIQRNIFKLDSYPMTYNMDHLVQNGIPMSQFAIYNPGEQYQSYTSRNKPPLIPKKVHIIWIKGQMPIVKRKILELNQELYPDFQFFIWSKDNITKGEFPMSYDLLQNVYNMENTSRYSKRATMADIMRHEIMYNHGGFYMDTSMYLFSNVFYKWLSYKFALATERPYRHRWAQSMCIFGVMPKFPGLLRIISHNNTNRYNLWLRDAMEIAGPHNFRWTVRGYEEYDPDYLIMSYDTFYPITYSIRSDCNQAYCYIDSSFHTKDDEVFFKQDGRQLIKNCGKYYPYSFGKEINAIGSSWQNSKW